MFTFFCLIFFQIEDARTQGVAEDVYNDFLTEAYTHTDGTCNNPNFIHQNSLHICYIKWNKMVNFGTLEMTKY